jgi:hypothetical protein
VPEGSSNVEGAGAAGVTPLSAYCSPRRWRTYARSDGSDRTLRIVRELAVHALAPNSLQSPLGNSINCLDRDREDPHQHPPGVISFISLVGYSLGEKKHSNSRPCSAGWLPASQQCFSLTPIQHQPAATSQPAVFFSHVESGVAGSQTLLVETHVSCLL